MYSIFYILHQVPSSHWPTNAPVHLSQHFAVIKWSPISGEVLMAFSCCWNL